MIEYYFLIGAVVGLVVVLDGFLLLKQHGQMNSVITSITSGIEFFGALATIVFLYKYTFPTYSIIIPLLYLIHNILGWLYGFAMLAKQPETQLHDFVIPKWYAAFGLSVGVVYLIGCIYILCSVTL